METKYVTPVELGDDSYHFWHPGTETFLGKTQGLRSTIIGTPMAANPWEVRYSLTVHHPCTYSSCTLWSEKMPSGRRQVMQFCDTGTETKIYTMQKCDYTQGQGQKWILRSCGDEDG